MDCADEHSGVGVAAYSYEEAALSNAAQPVLQAILASADPVRELHADEWAFLQSESKLVSKLRHPVKAFRDAGAVIVEFGREAGRALVRRVMPDEDLSGILPPGLVAKAAAEWIFLGGTTIGGGTLGAAVGTAVGGPGGGGLGGAVGGFLGGALGQAVVVAIDP